MNLIEELLRVKSCSVVGLEKNTGKTFCLNYLLTHLPETLRVAVTSIGLDGENTDQVTGTHKPEIHLRKGMVFATSEKHYRQRHLISELLDISDCTTALGRLVTAQVRIQGKVILAGPGSTVSLRRWMDEVTPHADLILIDGALSRLSLASPSVSEGMILATGAAYSANIDTLVRRTKHIVDLIHLPLYVDKDHTEEDCVMVEGAVTNRTLTEIENLPDGKNKSLVIQDFTRVFADEMLWNRFRKTHPIYQRQTSRLLGITVNPTSPNGIVLDSDILCQRMQEAIGLPIYDLKKER